MFNEQMYLLWTLVEWVTKNNQDEQGAILEYSHMLKFINEQRSALTALLGEPLLRDIEEKMREHISDEQQHSDELTKIYIQLTGIPIAKD